MVTLTKGTVEFVPIKLLNVLGNVTTLDGLGLQHDLYMDDEAETVVYTGVATLNDGMIALPLIDTTQLIGAPPAEMPEGDYSIFIDFVSNPEHPRLGPFKFRLDD